jgi:hypothetical protein
MASKRRVVVIGARGVFGSLLARELERDFEVVAATRENLDFRGAYAVACAAGPFQQLDRGMVRDAVDAGAHWLDIADDAGWFFDVLDDRELDARAAAKGVAVIPGLSSFPAVACALVRKLGVPKQVDITLKIGNANEKGPAAMSSAANLETPNAELLRRELGVEAKTRVEFEMPLAAPMLRVLGLLPMPARLRFAKLLSRVARGFKFGSRGGAVEVRAGDRVAVARGADQRFAILPLVFALHHLDGRRGCLSPSVFDHNALLEFLG